jgi:thioredoxin 1
VAREIGRLTKRILKAGHEFERRVERLVERAAVVRVDDATFEAEVIRSPMPVVVDFYADWCAPCRVAEPVLLEMSARLAGRIKFARVNVDEATVVARSYGIHSIPTYLFLASGTERGREVGPLDPVALRATLRRYFPTRETSDGTPATR